MAVPLRVVLPDSVLYEDLVLADPLDPQTWAAKTRAPQGEQHNLLDQRNAAIFFQDVQTFTKTTLDLVFISVSQDDLGRHNFVNLDGAASFLTQEASRSSSSRESMKLPTSPEGEVKALREKANVVLWYARAPVQENRRMTAPPDGGSAASNVGGYFAPPNDDLCPRKSIWASNYSVIPDLSLGATQRLILCDEATLCRNLPEERIFEHLQLIVNCHESSCPMSKYKVGSCSQATKPAVICQAVHEWHSLDMTSMNEVNDHIQFEIWEKLQRGTVAVHCLAGIHRAACIVACHFLWRHYTLGHQGIPSDPTVIYQRLKSVRPAVSPAYTRVLQSYEKHLKRSQKK